VVVVVVEVSISYQLVSNIVDVDVVVVGKCLFHNTPPPPPPVAGFLVGENNLDLPHTLHVVGVGGDDPLSYLPLFFFDISLLLCYHCIVDLDDNLFFVVVDDVVVDGVAKASVDLKLENKIHHLPLVVVVVVVVVGGGRKNKLFLKDHWWWMMVVGKKKKKMKKN